MDPKPTVTSLINTVIGTVRKMLVQIAIQNLRFGRLIEGLMIEFFAVNGHPPILFVYVNTSINILSGKI